MTGRDRFYDKMFEMVANDSVICGCNFWAWGGYGSPAHTEWQPGDNYCGDPAQEQQGLNSVFATDSTTIALIRKYTKEMF